MFARGSRCAAYPQGSGRTGLIQAALGGHLEVILLLIDEGADVHAADSVTQARNTKCYCY